MDTQKDTSLRKGAKLQNGRYTIVRVLGQGGFGITYQAMTKEKVTGNLGEMEVEVPVALKEFFMKDTCLRDATGDSVSIPSTGSTDQVDKYRQKFIKEAHNLAQLNHPNIVHVADVFEENNTVYYVMQFLRDGSLRDKLKENGPFPEEEAKRYTLQIAEALDYMHTQKHMCHYDVKPGNILLNGDKAMLIDFGISKNYTSDGRETSATPVGLSKGFAPLEQFQQSLQDFSPVSDIYSLGATLYNLVTGEVPPEASTVNEEGLGERPANVGDQVWNAIVAAMQPRRKDRPQTMKEFIAILQAPPIPVAPPVIPVPDMSEDTLVGTPVGYDDDEVVVSSRPVMAPPPPPIPSAAMATPQTPPVTPQAPESDMERTVFTNEPTPSPTPKPEPKPAPRPEPKPEPDYSYNIPPKKKSKAPLIIGVFLIFLLLGGGVAFFVVNMFLGDNPTTTTVTTAADTVTDEPVYGNDNSVAFTYTGEVNSDKKPHGQGVAKYTDSEKDTYTGKFQNGLRVDDNATLTFKNGDSYKGSFVADQYGEGVYTIKQDGSYFKGTFRDFLPYNGAWFNKSDKQLSKVVNGVDR